MFRNSLQALILRILGIVIWLAATVLFARVLTQDQVGALFYFVNIAVLGGTVTTIGYDVTILRYGSSMWSDEDVNGLARIFGGGQVMVGLAAALLALGLCIVMVSGYESPASSSLPMVVLVTLAVALSATLSISRDLLRSINRLRTALIGETVVRTAGFALFAGFLILAGVRSATILFCGYLLALLLANLVQHRAVYTAIGSMRPAMPQIEHIKTAIGAWVGVSSGILMMRLPGVVVGITAGLTEAALYFAVDRVAQMTNLLTSAIRTATAPDLARASQEDLQEEVARASALIFLAGLIGGLGVIALGTLVLLALGSTYFAGFPALVFLLIGNLAPSIFGPCPLILNMRGKERIGAFVSSGCMFVMAYSMILVFSSETALDVAQIFAAALWGMYLCSWIATRSILGITAGVFSVRPRHLQEVGQEMAQMWSKLKVLK